jgi:hypothetical protein
VQWLELHIYYVYFKEVVLQNEVHHIHLKNVKLSTNINVTCNATIFVLCGLPILHVGKPNSFVSFKLMKYCQPNMRHYYH